MKFRLTGIAASLALAGAVHAADAPGFNDLDRNGDGRLGRAEAAGNASLAREFAKSDAGKLSRAEAAANPKVARKFAESDGDKDGFLSRTEYLKTAAAEDCATPARTWRTSSARTTRRRPPRAAASRGGKGAGEAVLRRARFAGFPHTPGGPEEAPAPASPLCASPD